MSLSLKVRFLEFLGKRIHLSEYEADSLADDLKRLLKEKLKFQESNTEINKHLIR